MKRLPVTDVKSSKHRRSTNVKSTKFQAPSSRETPTGKHQIPGSRYTVWAFSANATDDALVLREESPAASSDRHSFDLEERTAIFGEKIVRCSKKIPCDPTNNRLIDPSVGAGTSVGANYCEAYDCVSQKDFRYTIKRCLKESKETRFFLRMVAASEPALATEARDLYREASELVRIFASMCRK